jgi:N6-L-threonylcarbamoyladenine synthase
VILGIETSCDETAAALVTEGGDVRANVVSSQAGLHARFGGVVPEVASRRHLELIVPVIRDALTEAGATLDDVERIAVTQGPGLVGALLVGVSAAKALAWARRLPLVPVDHLQGHVASLFLEPAAKRPVRGSGPGEGLRGNREVLPRLPLDPPFLCLLASGGHTMLLDVADHGSSTVLGATLDDAAGEAFDKGARLLGLG